MAAKRVLRWAAILGPGIIAGGFESLRHTYLDPILPNAYGNIVTMGVVVGTSALFLNHIFRLMDRSEEELRELQAVIESAMGFNATRGDRIKIASVPFRDRVGGAELEAPRTASMPTWMPYALGGAGLLVVATAWLVLARRRRKVVLEPEVLHLPGATVKQAQAALAAVENKGDPAAAMAALAPAPAISPSREDILALAAADPERTADIIRAWLSSDSAA